MKFRMPNFIFVKLSNKGSVDVVGYCNKLLVIKSKWCLDYDFKVIRDEVEKRLQKNNLRGI